MFGDERGLQSVECRALLRLSSICVNLFRALARISSALSFKMAISSRSMILTVLFRLLDSASFSSCFATSAAKRPLIIFEESKFSQSPMSDPSLEAASLCRRSRGVSSALDMAFGIGESGSTGDGLLLCLVNFDLGVA